MVKESTEVFETTEATKEDINKRLRGEGNKTKANNYLYKYNSALSPARPGRGRSWGIVRHAVEKC
jgi:hypothetical protein